MSRESGNKAEDVAAKHLKRNGYRILNRNWRTPTCEIDIVAIKKKSILFVEVKYRARQDNGAGFSYITTQKQNQMAYAAELWVQTNEYEGEFSLAAVELEGEEFEVTNFVFL